MVFRTALGPAAPRPSLLRKAKHRIRRPSTPRHLHPRPHCRRHCRCEILINRKIAVDAIDKLGKIPPRLTTELTHRKPRSRLKHRHRCLGWRTPYTGEAEIDQGEFELRCKRKIIELHDHAPRTLPNQNIIHFNIAMIEPQAILHIMENICRLCHNLQKTT